MIQETQKPQLNIPAVSGSEYDVHPDCPKICKCKKPEIAEPHLGDGGYDWCNICSGVIW